MPAGAVGDDDAHQPAPGRRIRDAAGRARRRRADSRNASASSEGEHEARRHGRRDERQTDQDRPPRQPRHLRECYRRLTRFLFKEAEMIAVRKTSRGCGTRQALALKRSQGVRLGRPPTMSPYAIERIRRERAAGKSLAAIANGLNADRIPTAQGGRRWYPATSATPSSEPVNAPAASQTAGSATCAARASDSAPLPGPALTGS